MLILSEPLKTYHRVLVDEFVREWQFLFDVIANRAAPRADFTDKLIGIMKFSVTGSVSISMSATQVVGAELINKAFEVTVDWVNAKRQDRHNDAITLQQYQFDTEAIRILVDAVALEACHRYQRVILQQLSDEPLKGVTPLATTGVERMLEYLVRAEKQLSFENLLEGLIAGHSGAYVMKGENTQLNLKNTDDEKKFQKIKRKVAGHTGYTAEGVYGRSALMIEDGTIYALLDKKKAKHRVAADQIIRDLNQGHKKTNMTNIKEAIQLNQKALFHFGYAKAIKDTQDPKYGYAHVSKAVVDQWYNHQPNSSMQLPSALSPAYQQQLENFKPKIVAINRSILEAYLNERRQTPLLNLKEYVKTHAPSPSIDRIQLNWSEAEIVIFEPDLPQERDLQTLSLAGADLSDCVFQGCIFGENLTGTQLQNADCRFSDFSRVRKAMDLNLTDAELQHTIFAGAQLQKANLNGANLSYANACGADLKDAWILGTSWYKANVTKVTTGPDLTGLETKLKNIQAEQTKWIDEQQDKQKKCDDSLENQSKTADTLRQQLSALQDQLQKLQQKPQQTELSEAIANLAALIQKVEQEQQCRLAFERMTNNTLVQLETAQKQTEQALQQVEQTTTTTLTKIDAIKTALRNKQTTQQKEIADLTQEMELLKKQQSAFILMAAEVKSLADTVLNQGENINDLNQSVAKLNKQVDDVLELQRQEFKKFTDQIAKIEHKVDDLQQQIDALKQQPSHTPLSLNEIKNLAKNAQQSLRSSYQNRQEIKGLFGKPFKIEGQYINLQMLYHLDVKKIKDEKSQQELESKKTQDHRVSSFEDLFGDKRNISSQDLFKPNKDLFPKEVLTENKKHDIIPNFLLIQGRAGIGKTTFVQYIAREWASGKWHANFEWVFTLTLRELRSPTFLGLHEQNIQLSLWEWIYYSQFASQSITPSDFQQLWQHVIEPAIQAKTVLIILDGFDEVPQTHACQTALKALLEKEYASITKIITTRPYGTSALPDERRNCEIIGFTDQNIEQYIKTYFAEKDTFGAQLMTLLKNNSILWGTCHIPVNINLICGITEVNTTKTVGRDLEKLQTMTGIYTNMEWKLYERAYLIEQETATKKETTTENVLLMSDAMRSEFLLKRYDLARRFLASLAFSGMQNQEIILSRERIDELLKQYQISPVVFIQYIRPLGVIKPLIDESIRENEQSYEFIHLTFQEYYAALHVAFQLNDQHTTVYMQHIILTKKLNPHWQIVWWFVAGLLRVHSTVFASYIGLLEGNIPGLNSNSNNINLACDLIGHYELGLLARCLEEGSPGNEAIRFTIQQRLQQTLANLFIAFSSHRLPDTFSSPLIISLQLSPGWLKQTGEADLCVWLNRYLVNQHNNTIQVSKMEIKKRCEIAALIGLLKLTTPSVLKTLSKLIRDQDSGVRYYVAQTVWTLGAAVVTPEFLKALSELLRDKNDYVRESAIDTVRRLGASAATPEFLKVLTELLRDKDSDVRSSATDAVGHLGASAVTPEFLKVLSELLRDKDSDVRRSAANAVGHLGASAVTPDISKALIELLRDKTGSVRRVATNAVAQLGAVAATPDILKALSELLQDKDSDMRSCALDDVGKLRASAATPEFLKVLSELLRDKDSDVRGSALGVVAKIGASAATPEFLKALIELFRDKDSDVRRSAAHVVCLLEAAALLPEFLKALIESMRDTDKDVRTSAAQAVGQLGAAAATPDILKALLELMRDEVSDARKSAAQAVGQLGAAAATPDILKALLELMRDEVSCVRWGAAYAVGNLGAGASTPDILKALLELMRDEVSSVRWSAANAVGKLGAGASTPDMLKALIELLRDKESHVQRYAADAVGKLGAVALTPDILKAFIELMRDKDEDVRRCAARVVGKLGAAALTTDILKALIELMRDKGPYVRASAAKAVGKLGAAALTTDILKALLELMRDEVSSVRWSAANAVGKLGAGASTPDMLKALLELMRDTNIFVRHHAAKALSSFNPFIPTLIKNVIMQWLRLTHAEKFRQLSDITWMSYTNGMNRYQIYFNRTNPSQQQGTYILSGYMDKEFFEIALTFEQAAWLRCLTPLIIEQHLKNTEDETLFPQKILSLIQSWPKVKSDPLLADSRMPALLASPAPTHTSSTLIQNTYSTVHSPAMFTSAINSPNSTTATDPWENIFSPIKNENNNEFDWCFKMKILISQEEKQVLLTFLSHEYSMMMTEDSLTNLAIMIQERGKEILPNVTLLFPTIIFTATNNIRAQQFVKYLLERSGLTVEKAAESTMQHDKSVKFSTQQ